MEYSREELAKALEKAKRDWEETLAKMTPEERAAAERKAQQALAEDEARRKKLLDSVAAIMGKPAPKARPNFCSHCGAPAGTGNFCEYCGERLV
ncbi:MAG: hypothetical protein IJP98_04730 [Clostridia bacterium]|nr:hypothetical protein [Clostridia bacterium]